MTKATYKILDSYPLKSLLKMKHYDRCLGWYWKVKGNCAILHMDKEDFAQYVIYRKTLDYIQSRRKKT
jgi:hypothetical protein